MGFWLAEERKCDEILRHSKELASHVHDFNHHIGVLQSLIMNSEYCEASKYVGKIAEILFPLKSGIIVPNHKSVDMILRQKISEAENCGIEVKHNIFMPPQITVDDMSLCIILGNALDNAIEACVKVEGEKNIFIDIVSVQNTLAVKILNSSNHVEITGDEIKTTKDEKRSHGLGLPNIRKAVEESGGNMVFNYHERVFSLYITFSL